MSENHVAELVSEADSDSGGGVGRDQSNVDSEPNTGTNRDQGERVDIGEPDDEKSAEDTARDDMFVDCPDELIGHKDDEVSTEKNEDDGTEENEVMHHQQRHSVEMGNGVGEPHSPDQPEKADAEKERTLQEYQEERQTVTQGVLDLHYQLKTLTGKENGTEVGDREVSEFPLREMIKECLEFVNTASEDRSNSETTISNLREHLSTRDREIEDLNAKLAQLMVSNDNFQVSAQAQLEKDRFVENLMDKMISSLATVVTQEQVLDDSISGKIVYIEEGTMHLIGKYNQILSEIYQLGQSFSEVGLDSKEQQYGNILAGAHGGLLELKRKETELVEKLAQLEDENRKLVDELDKEKVMIGTLNTELGNLKIELEQEKVKCANTKEKLSMAVTKGKALVQQRDSLKKSLADKSSELEKCLLELEEKSVALQAAEVAKEELTHSENMVASLQNSLLEKNAILDQVEEILSSESDDPGMFDVPEKLRWLADERSTLKEAFIELCKLKESLSLVDIPEPVSSYDLESQMNWIVDSCLRAREIMETLQEENSTIMETSRYNIDQLSITLLLELQEKYYLLSELTDLKFKYDELFGKNCQITLEKDQIVNMLVDLCGLNKDDEGIDYSNTSVIIDLCFQILKGQSGPFSRASKIDAELFESMQSLLYVRDQGLILYEDILEEEMLIRSSTNKLSEELKVASKEIIILKEERSSLLQDLDRSEEKTAMIRDKLSMAVKKGKGLVQDRDNLKGLLNERNAEIEQLKADLQKQESAVSEYRDEINRLSSDLEGIPKLQADLLEMERERNQLEQFLTESNNMLQKVMECIDGIILPVEAVFDEPIEKVKWLAGYVSECQDAKVHIEQELRLVKENASILEIKVAESQATVKSLERELSSSNDSVSQLAEEKTELEHQNGKMEEELQKVKDKVAEVFSTNKSLEDALSEAEKDISILSTEKEQAQASRVAVERELESFKDEAASQASKLEEASGIIKDLEDKLHQVEGTKKSLEDALSEAEKDISILSTEKEQAQASRVAVERVLESFNDEAASQTSKLTEASRTIKDLEDKLYQVQDTNKSLEEALSKAAKDISILSEEKEQAQVSRVAAERVLESFNDEAASQTSKLTEASRTIKDLEDKLYQIQDTNKSLEEALSQAAKDISILSEEKEQAQVSRVAAERVLESFKDEAASQTTKLAQASRTIKDLEDRLSEVEGNVNLLTEKYNADQVVKTETENELKKLQDEAANHANNLVGASETIKSLEDALSKAQDNVSALENSNKIAKQEISSLSLKLNSCMDELAGKNGNLENRSLKLIGLLNDLQVLMKDTTLFPRIKQFFERKYETLKNMNLVVNKIRDNVALTAKDTKGQLVMEENTLLRKTFLDGPQNFEVELDNTEIDGADIDTIILSFGKIVKAFELSYKHIADKFDEFSDSMDEFISPLHEKLLETETISETIVQNMESMKEEANTMKKLKEEQENIIATLQNNISVLLSACTDSTIALESEVDKNLGLLDSIPEVEKLNLEAGVQADHHKNSKYVEATHKLFSTSRKAQALIRQFECRSEQLGATIEDLQNKLKEATVAFELVTGDRDLNKSRVSLLESDIQSLQSACSELKDKLESYHALEEQLKEKEADISSMRNALLAKEETPLLTSSQMRDLFDKIDKIKIPIVESEDDLELPTSDPMKKLSYIIDSITRLHNQLNSMSHDKEKLQSILEIKDLDIKDMKEEVKQLSRNCEDAKMLKNELSELTYVLEKIMDILGAGEGVVNRKSKGLKELIPALEKRIVAIRSESDDSKSKAQELDIKLVGSQKVIDELKTKVKLLEDSLQDRTSQPNIVQDRSIYEASSLPTGSEITEVEEGSSRGKKAISPVSSAAHVRNMRKGSNDHLALDISTESDNLINRVDTDEDKGRVFKSLNTSGFVPKHGKLIADRIDGLWVSGGRVLMSRPRARLGVVGYLLILHIWLLGTIL